MKDKKLNINYGLIQGCYWLLAAVFLAFMTPILQEKGFTNSQIGILLGVRCIATVISQPIVSNLADKYVDKIPLKIITAIIVYLAGIFNLLFLMLPMSFVPTVVLFFFIGAVTYCISPMIDAVGMEFMNLKRKLNYTLCRSVGSATWAFACIGVGLMITKWGADSVLVLGIVFLFILGTILLHIETAGIRKKEEEEIELTKVPHSLFSMLKSNKGYTWFLIAYTLTYMSSILCNTFQIDVITGLGGNNTSLGYAEFILAISEVPVIFFYSKVEKKIGLKKILIFIFIFGTLKSLCQSFAPNLACFMLVQLLEMLSWGMSYTAVVRFVMKAVPAEDLVKGQGLISVAGVGIGNSVGAYISGIIYDIFDLKVLLILGVLIGIVSIGILLIALYFPFKYCENKKLIEKESLL